MFFCGKENKDMQIGDLIVFNEHEWRVLNIRNNAALIITEKVIENRTYHNSYVDSTWADCELRKYLNGEFCDRFNAAGKSRIIKTLNVNPDNPWYDAKGGEDTEDSIFLLGIDEVVCKYFGDSSAILQNPGNRKYKYWFDKNDENNSKRLTNGSWWLRSPGRTNYTAAYIHGLAPNQSESSGGCVGINGNNISSLGGVRPALWLKQ